MAVHSTPHRVRFDAFDVDLRAGELHRDGSKLHLQDKPFQILALLLERPGEVVTREELREHVWPADTFVDFEHGVNTAVKKLRQALDDAAGTPRYVETLPRRGYRFIGAIARLLPSDPAPAARLAEPAAPSSGWQRSRLRAAAAAALALAASLAFLAARTRTPPETARAVGAGRSIAVLPFDNLGGNAEDDYLADGLTATLTAGTRISGASWRA